MGVFIQQAQPVYGAIHFDIDTVPGSLGGERLVREGQAQLAGIAKEPEPETRDAEVKAACLGRDAIAVIVNAENPVTDLPLASLDDLFTDRVGSWREVGGPDLEVRPFIAGAGSATRTAFREAVLGTEDYAGCEPVSADEEIIAAVADHPGGIGHVSLSLLEDAKGVRSMSVGGEHPEATNIDYPISRPLYLLWRDDPVVDAFVRWARSEEGQRVVRTTFMGRRVIGSAGPQAMADRGTLVVKTETFEYRDSSEEFVYDLHRPYELLDRNGRFLRRVRNHVGNHDESPTRLTLPPGTYLIRTRTPAGEAVELFATVETGRITVVDVGRFLEGEAVRPGSKRSPRR